MARVEANDARGLDTRILVTPHPGFLSTATELAYVMLAVQNLQQAVASNGEEPA